MSSYFKYTKQAKNRGKGALSKPQNDKEIKGLNGGSAWRLGPKAALNPSLLWAFVLSEMRIVKPGLVELTFTSR